MINFKEIAEHYHSVIKDSIEYKQNVALACRRQELLVPEFKKLIDEVEIRCNAEGIKIKRTETFRTNAMQLHYFRTGMSKIKLNGMHHYGIGQDILCLDDDGKAIERGDHPYYKKMREIASELGLHLLGLWDAGHLQGIPTNQQNALRQYVANYEPAEVLILKYGMENHFVMNLKEALQSLGYEMNLETNFFGDSTDDGLRKFQTDNGLTSDGICGVQTYKIFLEKYNIDLKK